MHLDFFKQELLNMLITKSKMGKHEQVIWRWLKHWSLKRYQTPPVAHKVFLFPFIHNANHVSRSNPQVQPGFLSYRAGKMLSRRKVVSRVDLDQTDRTYEPDFIFQE